MYDISELMKTIKQRFARWYNRRHKRKGVLWADRFQSVLIEPRENAVCWYRASVQAASVAGGGGGSPPRLRLVHGGPGRLAGIPTVLAAAGAAGEEAVYWLRNPRAQMSQIIGGWAHPRKIKEAMARRVVTGSEGFVRRH